MVRLDKRVINTLALAVAVLVVVSCLAVTSSAAQDQGASQPPSPPQNPGYPVNVDGSEILRIFENVGSFTAQERAEAISARLQKLVDDPAADVNQIKIVETAYSTSLELGDNVLLVVTDNDARHLQVSRSVVAGYYLKQIRQAITIARHQHSKEFLVWAGIYAVVTLAIYLFLLWVVVVGFRHLLKVLQPAVAHMKGITIQQSELLEGRRLAEMVGGALRAIRVALIVGLTWIFLAREFTYFPWTREHGRRLLEYITTPLLFVFHGFINYLPNVFYILVIVTVMVYVMKFVRVIAREVERGNIRIPGFYPEWVPPTYKIVRFEGTHSG